MKFLIKLILFIAVFMVAERFCNRQTDGFAVSKINSHLSFNPKWEITQDPASVRSILSHKFYYLSKGAQCYVFASADNQYVLKFFRQKLFYLPWTYKVLPSSFKEKKLLKKKNAIEKDFQSYCLAYQELKEETGLVFIHLNKGIGFDQPLVIVDKLGIEHSLDPNEYEFFIQKKVMLIPDQLDTEMKNKNLEGAKETIRSLFALIHKRIDKKIVDADANLKKNFGICNGQAIQIDIGRFSKTEFSKRRAINSLNKRKEDLQFWINEHYPELSEFFQSEYERSFAQS